MCLGVLTQMITSHEAFVAYWTGKAFFACMRSQMPLEFIRPREALPAEQPVADERPFPGVPS